MMSFPEIVSTVNSWVWGTPFICLCFLAGLYFSVKSRFLQVRYLKSMISLLFEGKSSQSGISSFQAFVLALAGRIGIGNIVGVATAIALGGPGSIFWMWIITFFGASTAFVEAVLGQVYKERIDGNYRGGPAYYILKGLKMKKYAMAFALVTILALGVLMPGLQSNAIGDAFYNAFGMSKILSACIVVFLVALVIFGGVKRLASVAEIVTPFMALGYVIIAFIVIGMNYNYIPSMFALIFRSAFGFESAVAGIVGAAVSMGVKRGIFANEAGQGTAPHAAAAAEVSHPVKQGLVQAFSIYVDTLMVCTATAFIILITGMYRVYDSAKNVIMDGQGLPDSVVNYGPIYTQHAVDVNLPGFGSPFIAIALFLFAFTTIMSYYLQAETNVYFLFKGKKSSFIMVNLLRVVMLTATFFTSINAMTLAWDLADIGVAIMAWLNLIAILLLQKPVFRLFKDYEEQLKSGIKDPVFDPDKLKIADAEEWEQINKSKKTVV